MHRFKTASAALALACVVGFGSPATAGEFTDLEISKVAERVGAMAAKMDRCLPQILGQGTGGPQVEAYVTRAVVDTFLSYNARCEERPTHQIGLLRQIVLEERAKGFGESCSWGDGMSDSDKRMIRGWSDRIESCDARHYILSASAR